MAGLQDTPEVDEAGYAELERAELNRIMEKFLHEEQVAWTDMKIVWRDCDRQKAEANERWTQAYTRYREARERLDAR